MDDAEKRAMQEFNELQQQVLVQAEMHGRTHTQERALTMSKTRCALTKTELSSMPDATRMFKSIGRAYFCSPKTDVIKELDDKAAQLDADIKKVHEQREALEKKMGDADAQLRELLKQSPSLVRRYSALKIE